MISVNNNSFHEGPVLNNLIEDVEDNNNNGDEKKKPYENVHYFVCRCPDCSRCCCDGHKESEWSHLSLTSLTDKVCVGCL